MDTIMTIGEYGSTALKVCEIMNKVNKGTLTCDNEVQRGMVWNQIQKSKLIDSILRGVKIPPVFVNQTTIQNEKGKNENYYDVLDGKQRITTICDFVSGGFELKGIEPFICTNDDGDEFEIDVNEKKFEELPDFFQNKITNQSIAFTYYIGADQDAIEEIFLRINNGKPLTNIEKTRVMVKDKVKIKQLASHPIFERILTKSGLNSKTNDDIVMKAYISLYEEEPCLDNKFIAPYFMEHEISDERVKEMETLFDFAVKIEDTLSGYEETRVAHRMFKKKTHFIASLAVIKKAIEKGVKRSLIAEFLANFFTSESGPSVSNVYNATTESGAGHKEQVIKRNENILQFFDNYMKETEAEEEIA